MTSIVRPRAVEYGFSRLTPTAERYRVPGAGAIWVSIESGDRLSVRDPEGGQSAEIAVLDASGRDDAAALSAKSDSQATGLRQVLRDAGEAAQPVIVELRRRRIDPRNLRAVIEDRVVTRIGSQQDREIDVRIIAATNRDLSAMVRAGAFRADLFYRVSVIALAVPALRDQPDLIDSLIDSICTRCQYGPDELSRSATITGLFSNATSFPETSGNWQTRSSSSPSCPEPIAIARSAPA